MQLRKESTAERAPFAAPPQRNPKLASGPPAPTGTPAPGLLAAQVLKSLSATAHAYAETASARLVGKYYPYGQEEGSGNPANGQEKFATYTRDAETGLDYADQRYYAGGTGNFTTPDPTLDNVDYSDPLTWNAYAYTNGDPINFNDPDGLTACGDFINVANGRSIRSMITTYDDLGYLAQTIWHEAGPVYVPGDLANINNFITEQAWIATALENRYDIAHGRLTAYTGSGGTVNPAVFGGSSASLSSVVLQAAGNNQSWGIYTNGQADFMDDLKTALGHDASVGPQVSLPGGGSVSSECFSILSAVTEALTAQSGARYEPNGVILTYWNKASNDSPDPTNTQTVAKIRALGNTYYGYYATSQPRIRRPPAKLPGKRRPRIQ